MAEVRRGYVDPPSALLRSSKKLFWRDGHLLTDAQIETLEADDDVRADTLVHQPAVGLAISTAAGGNVVTMGQAVERRRAGITRVDVARRIQRAFRGEQIGV